MWGIGAVAAALTAAAPWLEPFVAAGGWALLIGMMVTAFMDSPVSFAWLAAAVLGWVVRRGRPGGAGRAVAAPDVAGRRRRARRRRAPTASS